MSPRVSDLSESKYLKQGDCDPAILVTIAGYEYQDVSLETSPKAMKYILHFEEDVKPLVLNQTNGVIIQSVVGSDDLDEWGGKKIVLYRDPNIMFSGKLVGGIRARAPKNEAAPPTKEEFDKAYDPNQQPPDDSQVPF
jgi:hypothetical protein